MELDFFKTDFWIQRLMKGPCVKSKPQSEKHNSILNLDNNEAQLKTKQSELIHVIIRWNNPGQKANGVNWN